MNEGFPNDRAEPEGVPGLDRLAVRSFVQCHTADEQAQRWIDQYRGQKPLFACVLGFTETGLIPGISAAGATPRDRQITAIADAEFLVNGPQRQPAQALPSLEVGASPVLISRAVVAAQNLPVHLFNAGLPQPPTVAAIDLQGQPAACLSRGTALPATIVRHLFQQGLVWGERLALQVPSSYVILGECVVGGTTTALAVLTALGIPAIGKVNSSHPICNHQQKWNLVQQGLGRTFPSCSVLASHPGPLASPVEIVAAIGDPMQAVVAGMTIAASQHCGVLLAGGTQMLAVYALTRTFASWGGHPWRPERVVVGTTRWVAEDPTGDTIGLAREIGEVPLLATPLSFATSRFATLRAYEQGFVKEGVGAGGCAIAAALYQNWQQPELIQAIEQLAEQWRFGGKDVMQ
jgi:uncharacterized protein (TIGR00303 family)